MLVGVAEGVDEVPDPKDGQPDPRGPEAAGAFFFLSARLSGQLVTSGRRRAGESREAEKEAGGWERNIQPAQHSAILNRRSECEAPLGYHPPRNLTSPALVATVRHPLPLTQCCH